MKNIYVINIIIYIFLKWPCSEVLLLIFIFKKISWRTQEKSPALLGFEPTTFEKTQIALGSSNFFSQQINYQTKVAIAVINLYDQVNLVS